MAVGIGYQEAKDFLRTIHPHKGPRNGELSREEVLFNKTVATDRLIVEYYFGYLCGL